MRYLRRVLYLLLIIALIINTVIPLQRAEAASKYGVIIGDKAYNYKLYSNLTVISPSGNIMVRAYSLCKALGLTYSYDKETRKLTIKNPNNGKYLVYTRGSKTFYYYSGEKAKPASKTATYKCYYDSGSKSNVIHASTLSYIVSYNYYKDVSKHYYGKMGYKGIFSYSINSYSSYDIPITDAVIDYVNAKTYKSAKELLDAVRLNMIMRKSGIILKTNRAVMNEIGSSSTILDVILGIDSKDTSKDADYLSLLIDNIEQKWSYTNKKLVYPDGREEIVNSGSDPATLTINIKYESTLKQERIVDSLTARIIKSLKLTDATDYEKVKKIHDYIINLAQYDTTYIRSSAYDILVHKTAVCEGYTLAAYRLFTDAGLESRIIIGKAKGEDHAWNIVKVDGQWYNIDLTWDDPISSTGKPVLRYDYFLKNEADFKDHKRLDQYNTALFKATYPIAKKSY